MDNNTQHDVPHLSNEVRKACLPHSIKAPPTLLPALMQRLQNAQSQQPLSTLASLIAAFESKDETVRATAIRELAQWHSNTSDIPMHHLLDALTDTSWLVREAAIFTLDALRIDVPQEYQMMGLLDENEFVREAARLTFVNMESETTSKEVRNNSLQIVSRMESRGSRGTIRRDVHSVLRSADSLFLNLYLTNRKGAFMAGQRTHDDNTGPTLDEIMAQQHKRRRTTLGVTGGILAVLLIASLAFSWLAIVQRMSHGATGKASATLDKPVLSDTNQFNSPQLHWLDNTHVVSSDPYNQAYATIWNAETRSQQQENIFGLIASRAFHNVSYTWTPDSRYVVNRDVSPDTVPTAISSPTSFTVTVEVWNALNAQKLVAVSYHEKVTSTHVPFDQTNEPSPPAALVSPDSTRLAVAQNNGSVTLWSLSTGKQIADYRVDSSNVSSIQWSFNSQYLLAQSSSGLAQLWNTTTGNKVSSFVPPLFQQTTYTPSGQKHNNIPTSPLLSPDGKFMVAVVGTNTVDVWDAATAKLLYTRTQSADASLFVDWLSDSKDLFVSAISNTALHSNTQGGIDSVQVWSDDTKQTLLAVPVTSEQAGFEFSPSQKYFLVADASSQQATIWNTITGQPVITLHTGANFEISGNSQSIVWSPDERYIATLSKDTIHTSLNNVIQVWSATTGKLVTQYHSHGTQVLQVTWSPNGTYLASVSDGNLGNVMEVWRAPS